MIHQTSEGIGNTLVRRSKALLILPYFGSFGPWFPLYLHSLGNQHTLDLLLLSDAEPPKLPANARRVEMTFDELRELATERLGTPVRLHRTRNICDLKPAYGMVFQEFTQGYEYWAFGDEDVLYGDVDGMLRPHLDGTIDLVIPGTNSARMQGSTQGHLTVLRNDPRTNELAIRDPAYKQVLVSHEHWAYDENSWRHGTEISSFAKVVKEAEARGQLSIRWGIPSITHVPRRGRWYVYDGRSIHEDDGREILYYHWGRMRHRKVQWPSAEEAKSGFAFDRYGFYDADLGLARHTVRRTVGRVSELARNARRRLRKWRAAVRAIMSGPRSQRAGS
jgi:hypothetical protein